ncbi:hypothetical protein ACHQM5_016044 [Ranunculus cassubicifolius]
MEESIYTKTKELRLISEREIPIQQQRAEDFILTFRDYLQSIKLTSQQSAKSQVKLGQLKAQLREVEDDLVKALSVKTRKEAKHITISDSISATKAEIEELKKSLHDQKARKDEYATIMSQQLLALGALEEKANQGIKEKQEIQEIISWYNRVLGLQIEGGRGGIKVIFNNINVNNTSEEYFFVVQLAHNTYSLLNCTPHLDGTKELVKELNQTNGFFRFVRIMREKFQAAASMESRPQPTSTQPNSSTVSVSAPASPVSLDGNGSGTLGKENTPQAQNEQVRRTLKKVRRDRKGTYAESVDRSPGSRDTSPGSAASSRGLKVSHQEVSPGSAGRSSGSKLAVRRSSRVKVLPIEVSLASPDRSYGSASSAIRHNARLKVST